MMALAFSTNSDDILTKAIECGHDQKLKEAEIENYFELDKCLSFIENGSFERVALQFPDELIKYSFKVMKLIEEKFPYVKLYVLGDTSYGSCCVDEIAAEHINADCIIHFGRSCLSITKRLPVHFAFGKSFIDVQNFCQEFLRVFEDKSERILVLYDVAYRYVAEEIEDNLRMVNSSLIVSRLVTDEDRGCMKCSKNRINFEEKLPDSRLGGSGSCVNASRTCPWNSSTKTYGKFFCEEHEVDESTSVHQRFGRIFMHPSNIPLEDYIIVYIGRESLSLANLMLSYNRNTFFAYDPERKLIQPETANINKTLMKRYYLIQKTKEAKTIGIVAGTLGVADYLLIIEHLKKLIKSRRKKYYMFLMGKPNIAKMANFLEIDIFVLVACPENSLIDSQEFYKPIITPFELEIAFSRQMSWTGEYITDYREILQEKRWLSDMEEKDVLNVVEEPEYSLVSGNLIKNMNMHEQDVSCDVPSNLVSRNQESSIVSFGENSAASFLQARIWSGLEQQMGKNEVTNVVEGRTGIATGYTHEMKEKDS